MKSILLVVEPGLDGVFRHVEGLAYWLLRTGYRVSLAYSSYRGSDRLSALVQHIQKQGGRTLDLYTSNVPRARDISALWALRNLVRQIKPDLIHAHSSKAGALVRLLRPLGVTTPIFYTPNAYYGMGKIGYKATLYNGVERVLGWTGITINVSRDEADFALSTLGISPVRQRIVSNGVDVQTFHPALPAEKSILRARYGLPESAQVLGTVGRFSDQKDYSTLYRALIPLLRLNPNLFFLHLGKGELDAESVEAINSLGVNRQIRRIEYLPAALPVYQAADAFVLTSRYEGLSYAVLEALACDLPLILSNAPGNREFLRLNLSHCYSAEVGDVIGFRKTIDDWLQETRVATRPSNHRQTAEQQFSLPVCCGKVVEIYREVLLH